MNELALYSGGLGGILAHQWLIGLRTVCYVEINRYCQEILLSRIADGLVDAAPIWDDVKTFDARPWRGGVDIVTGGFPCQPFSLAGKSRGADDPRNCWPDTLRIIREAGPRFAFLENVPGIMSRQSGFYFQRQILPALAEGGFDVAWLHMRASDCGAPHLRNRLWILAHAAGEPKRESSNQSDTIAARDKTWNESGNGRKHMADDDGRGCLTRSDSLLPRESIAPNGHCHSRKKLASPVRADWWDAEPAVGRVVHGVARRVDRLTAIGNGQVPAVAARAFAILFRELMG